MMPLSLTNLRNLHSRLALEWSDLFILSFMRCYVTI